MRFTTAPIKKTISNGFVRLTKSSGGGGITSLEVGTTSITGGAVGRVLFEGTGNVLEESKDLFWDNTNGRLGIKTNTPLGILHLKEVGQTTRLLIDGDAGQSKIITYRTSGLQRFGLYCNNIAESGSNAGSDFAIRAYSDLGVLLSTPLYIKRSTGNVLINTTTDSGFKLDAVGGDARFNGVRVGRGAGDIATNNAVGNEALNSNTTGVQNTAVGRFTMFSNTTGSQNTAIGVRAIQGNVGGNDNTALGYVAGYFIADGTTAVTTTNQSVFIGASSKALADSQTNQIVIGYNAIGLGSNSVVLGNSSVTLTALRGNVLIGTTTDSGFKLDVVGTARISGAVSLTSSLTVTSASAMGSSLAVGTFSPAVASAQMEIVSTTRGFLLPRMTTTQKNAIATPASGLVVYDTTLGKLCVRGASAWETITSV